MPWKITVGLASHWPCDTDISSSPPTGSRPRRGRWAPAYALLWVEPSRLYLFYFTCVVFTDAASTLCTSGSSSSFLQRPQFTEQLDDSAATAQYTLACHYQMQHGMALVSNAVCKMNAVVKQLQLLQIIWQYPVIIISC